MYVCVWRAYPLGERFALPELARRSSGFAADGVVSSTEGARGRIVTHVDAGGGPLTLEDLARIRGGRARTDHASRTAATSSDRTRRRRAAASDRLGLHALGDHEPTPVASPTRWTRKKRRETRPSRGRSIQRRGAAAAEGNDAHLGGRRRRQRCVAEFIARLGSGVVVPGTGIHLNNMLGELDLAGALAAGRAADVDDGAVAGVARRRAAPRASAARAAPACAARSCKSWRTSSRGHVRRPSGRCAARARRGGVVHCEDPARRTSSKRTAAPSSAGRSATSSSAA